MNAFKKGEGGEEMFSNKTPRNGTTSNDLLTNTRAKHLQNEPSFRVLLNIDLAL